MKYAIYFSLFVTIPWSASADVIKIETNSWFNSRPLTWSGIVTEIEPKSQIVTLSFENNSRTEELKTHISRIYSLTFNNKTVVNKSVPRTRQDLTTPLASNPNRRDTLELTNIANVKEAIPKNIPLRRPDEASLAIYAVGEIKEIDQSKVYVMFRARGVDNIDIIEIQRSDVRQWIRGS